MAVKLVPGKNDLATVSPALAAQWDYEYNHDLEPTMVSAGSSKKVWWICEKGHHWPATIASRNAGAGCPDCARETSTKKLKTSLLKKKGNLAERNPDLASEWHPTKNGTLFTTMVTPNTHDTVWWLGKCGHEWQASVKARNTGNGCPYCSGRKVLSGFNDLSTVNPDLAKEWHPTKNGRLQPTDVTSGSSNTVWWKCSKGHEWPAKIKSRSKGDNCPFCSGKAIIPGENDLATKSPQLASEWHPTKNGTITPDSISSGSHTKVW